MRGAGVLVLVLLAYSSLATGAECPRIAIVIDDLGFQDELDDAVMAMDYRVAVAIIPEAPAARRLARLAGRQQRDVLIHLPLAGLYHDNCQPALTCIGTHWSAERMRAHLADALDRVEGAVGINNHQGSRFTANEQAVRNLVTAIDHLGRERGQALFVLDSRTSPTTLLEHKALLAGLKANRRHVFLDHSNEPEHIQQAWFDLLALARSGGSAIAIGHPRINTIRFLEQTLPELESTGIRLVTLSSLVNQRLLPGQPNEAGSYLPAP